MSFNLATLLTETTLAAPDAPVCRFGGTTTSYRELDEQSGRVAAGLQAAGLAPGQVVAVQLPNLPQFLITYFGATRARKRHPGSLTPSSVLAHRGQGRGRLVMPVRLMRRGESSRISRARCTAEERSRTPSLA